MFRLALTLCAATLAVGLASAPVELNLPPEPMPTVATDETFTGTAPLTIAHLRGSDEVPLGAGGFEDLREFLSRDLRLREALRAAGRGSDAIEIIGTDSHDDLIRRMDNTEFDVVFAPALVHVRQSGDYEVLGQISDPRSLGTEDRMGVMQTSVIFVNRTHPLFAAPDDASPENTGALAAEIASNQIALVSAASAVGYVYPLQTLRREWGFSQGPPPVFCDSAEEAVMAVLNNLLSIGACDEATFERVVNECVRGAEPSEIIRVIERSDPLPTAPVVVRRALHPSGGSSLGRALHMALQTFLDTRDDPPLRLAPAEDRVFDRLRDVVEEFYEGRP